MSDMAKQTSGEIDIPEETVTSEEKLRHLIGGYRDTALIYSAVNLGLPDLLQQKPMAVSEMARQLKCSALNLERFVNALQIIGLLEKVGESQFRLSQTGLLLVEGSPSPCREMVSMAVEQHWQSWTRLDYSVLTDKPAFDFLHGSGPFEWRSKNPQASRLFNSWLEKETAGFTASILEKLDLSRCTKVVDIAGGNGGLLVGILRANPALNGILFEQAHVIQQARIALQSADCIDRIEFCDGDFFQSVSVEGDVYILKSVIHDWNDSAAVQILQACRGSAKATSKLILVERLTGQGPYHHETTMLDVAMMAITGGRERSLDQYRELLRQSGYRLVEAVACSSGFYIIEARPV